MRPTAWLVTNPSISSDSRGNDPPFEGFSRLRRVHRHDTQLIGSVLRRATVSRDGASRAGSGLRLLSQDRALRCAIAANDQAFTFTITSSALLVPPSPSV